MDESMAIGRPTMGRKTYLVFGDLHGRVLPAFRLAMAWGREHGLRIDGLLQVGDLGYFPDPTRFDKATLRHAADDPMELGVRQMTEPGPEADAVFHGEEEPPEGLWFTAGNHEDFEALEARGREADPAAGSFVVDAYYRLRCIRDGRVEALPGPLRVGAIWGIDGEAPNARRRVHRRGRIHENSATALAAEGFDVLLSHDGPRDAVLDGSGSEALGVLIGLARPPFAFFGHYGCRSGRIGGVPVGTQVYLMAGLRAAA